MTKYDNNQICHVIKNFVLICHVKYFILQNVKIIRQNRMNPSSLHRCKQITQSIREHPLHAFFYSLSTAKLPEYEKYITNPMSFEMIQQKLETDEYKTIADWYADMLLVYHNALAYHKKDTVWHQVAEYCLNDFKKKYPDIQTQSIQNWYELINKKMVAMSELIAESPVPQVIDPLILSAIKKAEFMAPPSGTTIADLVAKINKSIDNPQFKLDILTILEKTQPDLKIEGEKFTVDADALKPLALNAILLYTSSH